MIFQARWLLPVDRPPIQGGWIEVVSDRIVGVGEGAPPRGARDLGDVALMPGLVNAHTHLELSWMADLVPPAASMSDWIRTLLRLRRGGAPGGKAQEERTAREAAVSMYDTGTVLVGEISNTFGTPGILRAAGLGGVVFHELLGFAAEDPVGMVRDAWTRAHDVEATLAGDAGDGEGAAPRLEMSVVAHAPYSVSPALFGAIVRGAGRAPLSVHLAESPEEIEFLKTGRGPIREMLEALGVWTDTWQVPGCDPVEYLAGLGYLLPGVLVVHGVYLTDDSLEHLRRARAVLVTCPRSNVWVGSGPPRLSHFYASRVPVAIGTDSRASTASLNLFDELAEIRRLAPEVSAASLLESATRIGAEALGFGRTHGTLSAGKRAAIISVDVPSAVTDVEEYLVGGVPTDAIHRVSG